MGLEKSILEPLYFWRQTQIDCMYSCHCLILCRGHWKMFQCTLDTEQVNQNSVNFFQGFYYEMTGLTGERSLTIVFLCNQAVIKTVVLNKYLIKFLLFQLHFSQWYFVNVPTLDLFLLCKNILTACALRGVHFLVMDMA